MDTICVDKEGAGEWARIDMYRRRLTIMTNGIYDVYIGRSAARGMGTPSTRVAKTRFKSRLLFIESGFEIEFLGNVVHGKCKIRELFKKTFWCLF